MADKPAYYKKIITKSIQYDFLFPAEGVIKQYKYIDSVFRDTSAYVTAPALTAYILWVLNDAVQKNIKTLYFLARDGLVLQKIAEVLCRTWSINIECKYLYCSRFALRLPLYRIDKTYTMDKLCATTYQVSLLDILARANITGGHAAEIAEELGVNLAEPIEKNKLSRIRESLEQNKTFDNLISANSETALSAVSGYLKQKFADVTTFALVDTGWLGSMQECISKLLNYSSGISQTSVTGYYLGMFRSGDAQYGEYNCFLFRNTKEMLLRFGGFSNNVAECLCAADHGMTVGYEQKNEEWIPVLADYGQAICRSAWNDREQTDMCVTYAKQFAGLNQYKSVDKHELKLLAKRLLLGLMATPNYAEAKLYGAIPFSDGMSVDVRYTLTAKMSPEQIKPKLLSHRVLGALTGQRNRLEYPVYWLAGMQALSGCSILQKLDINLLEILYWVSNKL